VITAEDELLKQFEEISSLWVGMKDIDVIEELVDMLDFGSILPFKPSNSNNAVEIVDDAAFVDLYKALTSHASKEGLEVRIDAPESIQCAHPPAVIDDTKSKESSASGDLKPNRFASGNPWSEMLPNYLDFEILPTAHLAAIKPVIQSPPSASRCTESFVCTDAVYESRRRQCGKWTKEEQAFADRLISDFEKGVSRGVENGQTLRTHLAERLRCDPLRISKRFSGVHRLGKVRRSIA
jgi:hypothetical protein